MTRYLLRMLPEEDRVRVEREFLADDDAFEHLLALEDELTYRWLRQDLGPAERRSYERLYLGSAHGRAKAAFARALLAVTGRMRGENAASGLPRAIAGWLFSPYSFAIAAAALSLVLLFQTREVRTRLARLDAERGAATAELERERARRSALEQQLAAVPRPAPAVSFLLLPGVTRGSELTRLQIPSAAETVRLELALKRGASYRGFRAMLRASDAELWSRGGLSATPAAGGATVVLEVPASVFRGDEYVLTLQGLTAEGGFDDAGEYRFLAVRR